MRVRKAAGRNIAATKSEMLGTAAPRSEGGASHMRYMWLTGVDAAPGDLVGDQIDAEAVDGRGREELDVRADDLVEDEAAVRQVGLVTREGSPGPLHGDARADRVGGWLLDRDRDAG